MFDRVLGSPQSMSRLVGVLAFAVVISGCGAKGNDREIEKLEEQVANQQATLVAVQDEIADTNATIEVLRAEEAAFPRPQPAATRTKSAQPKGEFHFVPVDIQKEDTGDGWTNYTVMLAAVNDSDKTIQLSARSEDVSAEATILTKEGFEYSGIVSFEWGKFYLDLVLPPGFRSRGQSYSNIKFQEPMKLEFRAASNSQPAVVESSTIGTINLESVATLDYPVNPAVGEIPALGSLDIKIPSAGRVSFDTPRINIEHRSNDQYWYLIVPAIFANENMGYDAVVNGICLLADGNGSYLKGIRTDTYSLFDAGPGQSAVNEIRFQIGSYGAKPDSFDQATRLAELRQAILICSGDDFEIVAQLSDVEIAEP